jgi:hypothetical protein
MKIFKNYAGSRAITAASLPEKGRVILRSIPARSYEIIAYKN